MQAGTLYYRVITRKLQGSGKGTQFILLAGFERPLTTATSSYYETLSPGDILQPAEIERKVAEFKHHGNASDVRDLTDEGVQKKLARLWNSSGSAPAAPMNFSEMGIGHYL